MLLEAVNGSDREQKAGKKTQQVKDCCMWLLEISLWISGVLSQAAMLLWVPTLFWSSNSFSGWFWSSCWVQWGAWAQWSNRYKQRVSIHAAQKEAIVRLTTTSCTYSTVLSSHAKICPVWVAMHLAMLETREALWLWRVWRAETRDVYSVDY